MKSMKFLLSMILLATAPLIQCNEARWKTRLFFSIPGGIFDCWESVNGVPGCIEDILKSLQGGQIQLSLNCCEAVLSITANCLRSTKAGLLTNPLLIPLIAEICPAASGASSNLFKLVNGVTGSELSATAPSDGGAELIDPFVEPVNTDNVTISPSKN